MKLRRLLTVAAGCAAAAGLAVAPATMASAKAAHPHSQMFKTPWGTWINAKQNDWYHTHPTYVKQIRMTMPSQSVKPVNLAMIDGRVSPAVFVQQGYFCGYRNLTACINNYGGGGKGNQVVYWDQATDVTNGIFDQYYDGDVDSGFPFTSSVPWGDWNGNGVYSYYWIRNGAWTGLSPDQQNGYLGNIVMEPQTNSALEQWVWDGDDRWVGAYATSDAYEFGDNIAVFFGYGTQGVNNGDPAILAPAIRATRFVGYGQT